MSPDLLDPADRPPGVPAGAFGFRPEEAAAAVRLLQASSPANWGPLRVAVCSDAHWRVVTVDELDQFDVSHGVWAWSVADREVLA